MPAGLIRIREKLQETVEYTRSPDESEVRQIAETWIKGAPTYAYDGSGLRLSTPPGLNHPRSGTCSRTASPAAMPGMATVRAR